jgi:hypothetical protein
LWHELRHDGFAAAITLSVAGGAALRQFLWRALRDQATYHDLQNGNGQVSASASGLADIMNVLKSSVSCLTAVQQTFISYFLSSTVGFLLIQAGRERTSRLQLARRAPSTSKTVNLTSPTLDATLLVLARAVDSLVQAFILRRPVTHIGASTVEGSNHMEGAGAEPQLVYERLQKEKLKRENDMRQQWTSQVDAFVFWACSARYVDINPYLKFSVCDHILSIE